MEWLTILNDETHNRRLLQIDLGQLANNEALLEDLYDLIAVELRKGESSISWDEAKNKLQNQD